MIISEVGRYYGDWLAEFDWSHLLTLTTRSRMAPETAMKIFRDTFVRRAERLAQVAVPFFAAIEGGALGDHAHVHAVVGGLKGIPCARIGRLWGLGRVDVRIHRPNLGGCWYLSKEIGTRVLLYDLSRSRFPRAREPYLLPAARVRETHPTTTNWSNLRFVPPGASHDR